MKINRQGFNRTVILTRREGSEMRLQCMCEFTGCTFPALTRRQDTAYVNDSLNWATLCVEHQHEADEYWAERWAEYYAGRMC